MPWRRKPARWLRYWTPWTVTRDSRTVIVYCVGPAKPQTYHENCHHSASLNLADLPDWDWYDISAQLNARNAERLATSIPG
jgi:hypothetical protein